MEKKKVAKKTNTTPKKKTVKKVTTKKRVTRTKKNKKKAFTLIELLAVIIILGVLMVIAIPAVTSYIQNSRKSSYVATAHNVVAGARTKVNDGTLSMHDKDTTYYLPYLLFKGEKEWKSPYGDFEEAYVVVTFNGNGYDYYWTSRDTTNTGIYLTYNDLLDNDKIASDMTALNTNIGVGNRTKIVVYDENGSEEESKPADTSKNIPEKGSIEVNDNETETETAERYFAFDSLTGTLHGLKVDISIVIDDYNVCAAAVIAAGFSGTTDEALGYCQNGIEEDLSEYPEGAEYMKEIGAITSYTINGYSKNVVIPEKINGVTVENIDGNLFRSYGIETIVIPSTVTNIDYYGKSSSTLYNIVNLTSRSFDWGTDSSFEFGIIPADSFLRRPIVVSESRTSGVTIDYEKMFSIEGETDYINVTLNNSDGYEVFYKTSPSSNAISINVGDTIGVNKCSDKLIIKKDNKTYYYGNFALTETDCIK